MASAAGLKAGATVDFNAMSRRERFAHDIQRLSEAQTIKAPGWPDAVLLLVALDAGFRAMAGATEEFLAYHDTLIVETANAGPLVLCAEPDGRSWRSDWLRGRVRELNQCWSPMPASMP